MPGPVMENALQRDGLLDTFSELLAVFLEEVRAGRWDLWKTVSKEPDGPSLDEALGTFSLQVSAPARKAHGSLLEMAQISGGFDLLTPEQVRAIELYALNSMPFHSVTRGSRQRPYGDWTRQIPEEEFDAHFMGPDKGWGIVNTLSEALQALPRLGREYDVAEWSNVFSGRRVFRGAITTRLAGLRGEVAEGGPAAPDGKGFYGDGGPVYQSPEDMGDRDGFPPDQTMVIREGDYVMNADFMSTSAAPGTAANFVARQLEWFKDPLQVQEYKRAHTSEWKNRTFFEIDFVSGKNITPKTAEQQAEILFDRHTLFQVASIHRSAVGTVVGLREVERPSNHRIPEVRNMLTGAKLGPDPEAS